MNPEDLIYLLLLFFCIGFGYFYRQFQDVKKKKLIGTGIGFFVIFVVSGFHILHPLITTLVNAFIILKVDKRKCHLVSFVFTFLHLIFFRTTEYFGIPYAPGHTNLVQMILTLKLVGLAFEVNSNQEINLSFADIFHYAFNYIGVLTGPYYKYCTFNDYFELPFSRHADWKTATIKKICYIPMWGVLFLIASHYWPLSYALTDEFYKDQTWLYRLWYVWPNFFTFRMRIYIGMTLSECVCTMAGFGAYPVLTIARPGEGPSTGFDELKKLGQNPEKCASQQYDFETIHNINAYGADFCTTFRVGMKHWNICVQHWLAINVYKRFPIKKWRTVATMVVSAVWHGVYAGYYFCILGVPMYLAVEDIYVNLTKDSKGLSQKIWPWILWFFKMFAFSYLCIAFHLLLLSEVLRYYASIYYCGHIAAAVMYGVGLMQLKAKKSKLQREEKQKVQ